jgi:hypothetical protein
MPDKQALAVERMQDDPLQQVTQVKSVLAKALRNLSRRFSIRTRSAPLYYATPRLVYNQCTMVRKWLTNFMVETTRDLNKFLLISSINLCF